MKRKSEWLSGRRETMRGMRSGRVRFSPSLYVCKDHFRTPFYIWRGASKTCGGGRRQTCFGTKFLAQNTPRTTVKLTLRMFRKFLL